MQQLIATDGEDSPLAPAQARRRARPVRAPGRGAARTSPSCPRRSRSPKRSRRCSSSRPARASSSRTCSTRASAASPRSTATSPSTSAPRPGVAGTQKGDEIVTLNPDDANGYEARFALEAKSRKLTMRNTLKELDDALENRDALAAIAVFTTQEQAPTSVPFHYAGNKAIVVLDKEGVDDAALRLAYMWARWVVRRELCGAPADELDIARVVHADRRRVPRRSSAAPRSGSTTPRPARASSTPAPSSTRWSTRSASRSTPSARSSPPRRRPTRSRPPAGRSVERVDDAPGRAWTSVDRARRLLAESDALIDEALAAGDADEPTPSVATGRQVPAHDRGLDRRRRAVRAARTRWRAGPRRKSRRSWSTRRAAARPERPDRGARSTSTTPSARRIVIRRARRRRPTPPTDRAQVSRDDLARLLVGAQPEERGVADAADRRPLGEAHLGHELAARRSGPRAARRGSRAGRRTGLVSRAIGASRAWIRSRRSSVNPVPTRPAYRSAPLVVVVAEQQRAERRRPRALARRPTRRRRTPGGAGSSPSATRTSGGRARRSCRAAWRPRPRAANSLAERRSWRGRRRPRAAAPARSRRRRRASRSRRRRSS